MKKDSAVSSVVGEMLMLAVVVILAGLFAVGAMSFLPGERGEVIDITADFSDLTHIVFTHRGGDVVSAADLKVTVYQGTTGQAVTFEVRNQNDDNTASVFDLGRRIVLLESIASGDEIRISTSKSIVYAGRIP
ncbi:MAG TPA: type IV pilin N-terminal domain-containing protein [Methanocorpusculum sp.]|nr:type IV pilin N-terminal domain-containing protein [Methanocorpusculum sp.]